MADKAMTKGEPPDTARAADSWLEFNAIWHFGLAGDRLGDSGETRMDAPLTDARICPSCAVAFATWQARQTAPTEA